MATYNGHNEDSSGNILLAIGNGIAATLETGTTASQAYTKGAYLYYNNRLCKVTAAIAKNATLTIGTNIAYTSIGAELTSHLRASNGNELYFDYKDSKPGYYPTASKTASQFVPFGGSSYSVGYVIGAGQNGWGYVKIDYSNNTVSIANAYPTSDANVGYSDYYWYAKKKCTADVFTVQPYNNSVSDTTENFGKFDTTYNINDKFCSWAYSVRTTMATFIGIKEFL